jgi:hypothetical protein
MEHLWYVLLLQLALTGSLSGQRGSYRDLVVPQPVLTLPDLPYGYEGLAPHLDSATLQVHHLGHHKAYCDKTNAALQEWRAEVSYFAGSNTRLCDWRALHYVQQPLV